MKYWIPLFLNLLIPAVLRAQHCQYDVTALIGVVPVSSADSQIIDHMRITLVDMKGTPVMHQHEIYAGKTYVRSEQDTMEFWRNPAPNKDTEHRSSNRESRHFSHVANHYILLVSSQQNTEGKYLIKIEDTDGIANGGLFETRYVPVHKENLQRLCNYYEPNSPHNTRNYFPIHVALTLNTTGISKGNDTEPKKDTSLLPELKPEPVKKNDKTDIIYTRTVGDFRFEVILNPAGVQVPAEKGSYARKISVYRNAESKAFFEHIAYGNRLKDPSSCHDSIEVADFDFDELPDFRICSKALQGTHLYFLNRPAHKTFVSDGLLGSLNQVTIDRSAHRITGFRSVSSQIEKYELSGKNLEYVSIETEVPGSTSSYSNTNKYIYKDGTLTLLPPKAFDTRVISKTVEPFRFTLELNPNGLSPDAGKGLYDKMLRIYDAMNGTLVFQVQLSGNRNREDSLQYNCLDISDYNFDGMPDIRIYDSKNGNRHVYFLSDREDPSFYQHRILSNLSHTLIDTIHHRISGELINDYEVCEYTFYGTGLDTLLLKKRNPVTEEYTSIMKFHCTRDALKPLPPENIPPKKIVAKKEFEDFNYDGLEDFRVGRTDDTMRFDYYLFNPKTRSFVYDSVFSAMNFIDFNREKKTITGSITVKDGLTTTHDLYEWRNGTFVNTRRNVITQVHPNSEEVWVEIYELKDGEMKLIDAGKIN